MDGRGDVGCQMDGRLTVTCTFVANGLGFEGSSWVLCLVPPLSCFYASHFEFRVTLLCSVCKRKGLVL